MSKSDLSKHIVEEKELLEESKSSVHKTMQELDEEARKVEEELQSKKAMQTLGALLRQLKQEKERRAKIEALKEAGIDPSKYSGGGTIEVFFEDDVIAAKLASKRSKKEREKKFMIYPEDRFRAYWDYIMTL
jgi:hypothetical protein